MAGDWQPFLLRDLIEIKHGFAFQGAFFHEEQCGDILLTPGNFAIGGGFKGDKFKYYNGPVPEEYILQTDDLIVTMTDLSKQSDTLGFPAFVPEGKRHRFLHNQRLGKIIIKEKEKIDKKFLFYLLRSDGYRNEVIASATGTTVKHTSPDRIKKFRFFLPPLSEQRTIAHILGTLDDKIELNRRMSETLEQMAQALFKSWFVDFDPVRRNAGRPSPSAPLPKGEGEHPLPSHPLPMGEGWGEGRAFDHLFPSRFVDSELGEIPEGWEVKPICELAEVVGGSTPKTERSEYWEGGTHHWVTPKDLSGLSMPVLLDTERKITDSGLAQIGSGLLPKGTVLLSSRAPIGYLAIAEVPVAVNQGFIAMKPNKGISNLFLLRWANSSLKEIVSHANGSTFLEISKANYRPILTVLPNKSVLNAFDQVSLPMYRLVVGHERESSILNKLRDALLPRLVSGELHVNDSEKFFRS